jgi:DNA repair protein RadD
MEGMKHDRHVLLQAATGAGKTIMFSDLIRRWVSQYRMRIAIMAHRRELITQAAEKLLKVWPQAPIGLACAGVSGNINLHAPVVIGSIQTLARRARSSNPFQLVIIDEVHRVPALPAKGPAKSQYHKVLRRLEAAYPNLRVLGVTATPFRLGHGYIYGDRCKQSRINLFKRLHYKIGISDLQAQGFLVPIRAKEGDTLGAALSSVGTSGGDYNLGQLSTLMGQEVHVNSAVDAYHSYGEGRKHVLIFCVTIKHAELVQAAFQQAGYTTGCVHSEMSNATRDRVLAEFAAGRIQFLTNVGVLTEGWDCPATDLIMLCRPTKSAALFVQMVGRGTRLNPGKDDLLVLDLADNFSNHGDPDNPNVSIPGKPTKKGQPMKVCPKCKTIVRLADRECHRCGHIWTQELVEKAGPVKMRDVQLGGQVIEVEKIDADAFVSRAGNLMVKLAVCGTNKRGTALVVNHFLDVEGNGHAYGRTKAREFWGRYADDNSSPPNTVAEALDRIGELSFPETLEIKRENKYRRIVGW